MSHSALLCRVLSVGAACTLIAGANVAHADTQSDRRAGDVLSVVLPVATLGAEWLRGERDGAWQYTTAVTASTVLTEVLKRATHVQRPDQSDDRSFPSERATLAFSSAAYVHRRYGLDEALPLYAVATYVGYTRVRARQHRWGDVLAGAGVSEGMSWWLVEPRDARPVAIIPSVGRRYVGLFVQASW